MMALQWKLLYLKKQHENPDLGKRFSQMTTKQSSAIEMRIETVAHGVIWMSFGSQKMI